MSPALKLRYNFKSTTSNDDANFMFVPTNERYFLHVSSSRCVSFNIKRPKKLSAMDQKSRTFAAKPLSDQRLQYLKWALTGFHGNESLPRMLCYEKQIKFSTITEKLGNGFG